MRALTFYSFITFAGNKQRHVHSVEKINQDVKAAMMAKEDVALRRQLRAIKAAIPVAQTEPGASKELSEERS
jgi:uncharacterized protein YqeY